jgi:intraflagellar transport protein 172
MAATPEMFEAADLAAFRRYLEACHLALVRAEAREANLLDLSAKAATSLLRYVGTIPADRAFFEAGIACRECGDRANDAFVFLNRYLDLTELMDDDPRGDPGDLDDDEFETTDVPKDFELPVEHFVKEATREEVRDWVLALSMDQAVDQTLSTRECGGCGGKTYVAALRCHRCGSQSEACVVTGYPVPQTERVAHEGRPARRDDWNRWTNAFGTDPWSGQHATPKY